jgi:hypothetical protein
MNTLSKPRCNPQETALERRRDTDHRKGQKSRKHKKILGMSGSGIYSFRLVEMI